MLQPVVRRTWAPVGQTPIHATWDRRDRMSVIGALSLSPASGRIGAYFNYQYENITTDSVVFFIKELHRHLQRKLIVVWDRWSVHRSAARKLSEKHRWFHAAEWLPSYCPELNPVEAMWSFTKYSHLANFIPEDVMHLEDEVLKCLGKQANDKRLKQSFFKTARLKL